MADGARRVPTGLLLAGAEVPGEGAVTHAVDPRSGAALPEGFADASVAQVAVAAAAAGQAAEAVWTAADEVVVGLLRGIAAGLQHAGAQVVALADQETALGPDRLQGELARTTTQLRMFADVVADRAQLDIVIEHADPTATPPRPDLRRMRVPLGPVAVFGASNFPLAFGVAGGDTASALAARCPVVAKAHPAHPGTSALVGAVVNEQVALAGMPPGTFSLLHGADPCVSRALVAMPEVQAVGFTGSTTAGLALEEVARARPRPIPVHAEMGSVNPVVVTPDAVAVDGVAELARRLAASVTAGGGQFCTKPGIVLVPADHAAEFVDSLASAVGSAPPCPLLTVGMRDRVRDFAAAHEADALVRGTAAGGNGHHHPPVVVAVDATRYHEDPSLRAEVFGPVVVVVAVADATELSAVLETLEGSLTGTVWSGTVWSGEDGDTWADVAIALLLPRVGRLLGAGVPTGVAVTAAQHHGGPFPATTAPQHTSVGTRAVDRFTRPVAFQDVPAHLLPPHLRVG